MTPPVREASKQVEAKSSSNLPIGLPIRQPRHGLSKNHSGIQSPMRVSSGSQELPKMLGLMLSAENWTSDYYPYGLYELPSSSEGSCEQMLSYQYAKSTGFMIDEVYYSCNIWRYSSGNIGADWHGHNINTGEQVFKREFSDDNGFAIQYLSLSNSVDPTSGIIYGVNYTQNGQKLQLVEMTLTKDPYGWDYITLNPVGTLEGSWNAIAFDNNGQLWGINYEGVMEGNYNVVTHSYLNKIDKNNAQVTRVGETGLCPQFASDMCFDPNSNTLYWTLSTIDDQGFLAEVNTTTGAATKVMNFPNNEEIAGLVIIGKDQAGIPGRATDLETAFENGSLSGSISFTTPENDTNGDPGQGELSYSIRVDESEIASGTCGWGERVTVPVTVDHAGEIRFNVILSANGVEGKGASTTCIIGHGTPKAPEATAAWEDGMMTVTWSRPTETVDGGYLSPTDPFLYEISDAETGELKVRVTDATSCSFALPEPETRTPFSYNVKGTCNGLSFISRTPVIYVGAQNPPYINNFNSVNSLDEFTIIDANNDGKVWTADGAIASIGYNPAKAMNDWMITPGIKLQAGGKYPFSLDISGGNVSFTERIEVLAGMAPTAEAMTISLIPVTAITKNSMETYEAVLEPTVTGTYYIGVHGISFKDMHTLRVDNLILEDTPAPAAPATVQNLNVSTDPTGALNAIVSFKTPTLNSLGNSLSIIEKVEILVNDVVKSTITEPEPGEDITEIIRVAEMGEYTFTVIAYNENGAGMPATVTTYVGFDSPAAPASVYTEETSIGHVSVEWDPVTTDINGTPLPEGVLLYDVYIYDAGDYIPVAKDVAGNKVEDIDLNVAPGNQSFYQFAVFGHWDRLMGLGQLSQMIIVGYPSEGFRESFPMFTVSNPIMISCSYGLPEWSLMIDANGFPSQDNDNGVIGLIGEYSTDTGAIQTGKFTVDHLTNPVMRFWVYNIYNAENPLPQDLNSVVVRISEDGGKTNTEVLSTTPYALGGTVEGWYPVIIDLTPYIGKTICFSVESTLNSYCYSVFDNFRTYSYVDHNLCMEEISAPERVTAGDEFKVAATIVNEGKLTASGHSVELFVNGEKYATQQADNLISDGRQVIEIPVQMHSLATEPLEIYATVSYAPDVLTDNNTSESITVKPILSPLPVVSGLTGEVSGNKVNLKWDSPDYENGMPATVTDDFDSYVPWQDQPGDWTTYDLDKSEVSGFLGIDIPNIQSGITKASFFVFNATEMPREDYLQFEAHSGSQYMAALQRFDNGELNDWLVSPELSGNNQVISFFAKSYSRMFTDAFEVYYSTGSTQPSDFIKVCDRTDMPNNWSMYTVELPQGAKRFAIRACAANSFMFMLDDVTYQSGTETTPLVLKGYNIWRDGLKLNDQLITDKAYTDEVANPKSQTYVVTAVYDLGESGGSNLYRPDGSGISSTFTKAEITSIVNTAGIEFAPDANLQPGIYVIRNNDGTISKVVIK